MKADWVIDILKDIRQFSEKNGLPELCEQLDDAIFIAAREIGASADVTGKLKVGAGKSGNYAGALADHEIH